MSVSVQQLKSTVRREIKNRLALLTKEYRSDCSHEISKQFLDSTYYRDSSRIAIYLSLPEEVQTLEIIKDIFLKKKECFIPRYTKSEMSMVRLDSLEDLESLPLTKWNIKQPSLTDDREDANLNGGVDLVVVPGLAFTSSGGRLGRGKGYYDRYLKELAAVRSVGNLKPAVTVGLSYKQQILPDLPTSSHDVPLNTVLYPKDSESDGAEESTGHKSSIKKNNPQVGKTLLMKYDIYL